MSEFNIGDKVRIKNVPAVEEEFRGAEVIITGNDSDIYTFIWKGSWVRSSHAYYLELVNNTRDMPDAMTFVGNDLGGIIKGAYNFNNIGPVKPNTWDIGNYTYLNLRIKNKKKNYIKLNINF